jgi:hypothetical protein
VTEQIPILAELDEYSRLCNRQSELLTRVVNAARGVPPELMTWSHHDAGELVEDLAADLDALRREVAALRRILRYERERRMLAELDALRARQKAGGLIERLSMAGAW